jgi:dipeptidyl aminopeptidase/acylaminoacyl peptidase
MLQEIDSSRPASRTGSRHRWGLMAAAGAIGVLALASCTTPPTTPGGTRYKDAVFASVQKTANITYASAPGTNGAAQTLLLDVYRPSGDTATKRPLIIFAYGGAFSFGSKDGTGDPAYLMSQYYAQRGYVTAMINYRLLVPLGTLCTGVNSSDLCRAAAIAGIEDGAASVRFLRKNAAQYGIDPDRIAFGGDSAGGVMAAGVGVMSEAQPTTNTSTPGVSSKLQAFMALSGGLPEATYVDAGDSPGILFTGTADNIVPSSFSTIVVNALTAAGVDAKLVSYPGDGHVPWAARQASILSGTTDFFYTHLNLAAATG